MNCSKKEVDKILLEKPLSDYYFAVLENRGCALRDEEYERIVGSETPIFHSDFSSKEVDDFFGCLFQYDDRLKSVFFGSLLDNKTPQEGVDDALKYLSSIGVQIRRPAILTVVDNRVYNICNQRFVDLGREMIICYDNLTNYYDESNARLRYFSYDENKELSEATVLLVVDDPEIIYAWEDTHVSQEESSDLSKDFLDQFRGKAYTLSNKNQ